LGNYVSGRLLFLGFGTSIGAAVIVDDVRSHRGRADQARPEGAPSRPPVPGGP
jgi:hypothetical protein